MLAEIMALFGQGVLRPLPLAAWDVRRAAEAFRFIGQAGTPARWCSPFPHRSTLPAPC